MEHGGVRPENSPTTFLFSNTRPEPCFSTGLAMVGSSSLVQHLLPRPPTPVNNTQVPSHAEIKHSAFIPLGLNFIKVKTLHPVH